MSSTASPRLYSFEEYEEVEANSAVRHEFVEGVIRAMAGGTARHSALAAALGSLLREAAVVGGCRVHVEGRRLDVEFVGSKPLRSYYPDVMVSCGEQFDSLATVAPCFVAEVLSDSTALVDLNEKVAAYTEIDGLLTYAIVSQSERRVVVNRRASDRFRVETYGPGDTIALDCPNVAVAVDDLYAGEGL